MRFKKKRDVKENKEIYRNSTWRKRRYSNPQGYDPFNFVNLRSNARTKYE